ncbi:MAG: 30S ribosomal protein S1 [Epulopiscium sp.]|nr:30S ribosomal protein S1 [Candidatus Epulonipiscium sp.]
MNDLENHTSENFEELLNQSLITLRSGEIVKGTIINVTDTEVSVNLGYKSDGIITKTELSNDPNINPKDEFKIGDEIDVYILRVNDGEGIVELSKKRVDAQKGWDMIQKSFEEGTALKGKVIEVVNGGVIVMSNEVRVFIPASLMGPRYIQDLNQFLGEVIEYKIIELDKRRRKIVGDHKQISLKEREKKKEEVLSTLEVGQKVKGIISNLTDFGAFVDLGGIDGLVHVSQISWKKIKKPGDVLKIGQEVEVIVTEINKENNKISLSMKKNEDNPWEKVVEKYPVDSVIKGKIVRMAPFGAFVELEEGVDGLIHISQIANKHVVKPEDELKIGEIVEVKVLDIDIDKKKISLSKKQVEQSAFEEE